MSRNKLLMIAGVILMAVGIYAVNLDITSKYHYFTNGAFFGIGLTILIFQGFKILGNK